MISAVMNSNTIFRQLIDYQTHTFTYLVGDASSKEALLIDPVFERVNRDLGLISELGLTLKYVLETHVHADHVTGAAALCERTGAKSVVGKDSGVRGADLLVSDGDTFSIGQKEVRALATPGHTPGCMSFLIGDRVFTGDALFTRGNGRTDFQEGSAETLFESIHLKLYSLPDETLVYPGHDYKGFLVSTIGEEKKWNPRISAATTKAQFVQTMSELKLDAPKQIDRAVPANLEGGRLAKEDAKNV